MLALMTALALMTSAAGPAIPPAAASSLPVPYLVKDLDPGPGGLGPDPGSYCLLPMGDLVLGCSTQFLSDSVFPAEEARYGARLFRSDGTAEGTYQLLPENRSFYAWIPASDKLTYLLVAKDHYYLIGGHIIELALWRTDGTREGTVPLTEFAAIPAVSYLYPIAQYLPETDRLLFRGYRPSTGDPEQDVELWISDGTAAGTRQLVDLGEDTSGAPQTFKRIGGVVYFLMTDAETGLTLARTDGTVAGTYSLPNAAAGGATPTGLQPGDDGLFVFYRNVPERTVSLWHADGTTDGFTKLADWGPFLSNGIRLLGIGEGTLFLTVEKRDALGQLERKQLWASDGTPAGTHELPVPEGATNSYGELFGQTEVIGGRLYYNLDDGVHGYEPWVTDGTAAGTHILRDFCPGPCHPQATGYGPVGDEVLVHAIGLDPPIEAVIYNPRTDSFRAFADLCPGECTASVGVLTEANGLTYLYTEDSVHGQEIAITDGTAEGTQRITSFQDDPEPFNREILPGETYGGSIGAVAGGRFFFGANDGVHGYELWAVAAPGSDLAPPPGDPLTSPALPGFEVWVQIIASEGEAIDGSAEAQCLPETLCVSGALAGRSEVFVRVVGPKPNGNLWPTLVKFTTSAVDVWLRQTATGAVRHYRMDGASPGSSALDGLFDRDGFQPE